MSTSRLSEGASKPPSEGSSPPGEVRRVAERMLTLLREKPVQFMDLLRAFPDVPYRTILLAWGEVREAHRLTREEDGEYRLPPSA